MVSIPSEVNDTISSPVNPALQTIPFNGGYFVWIVRENSIIELKPDKMPVGKHDKDSNSFSEHSLKLNKGDMIFAFTDGMADQFGGAYGKKFMSKNLRELLSKNAHLPMKEQRTLLEKAFLDWIGNLEQIDDITIIGVRV